MDIQFYDMDSTLKIQTRSNRVIRNQEAVNCEFPITL
jgi:hypothetical protein